MKAFRLALPFAWVAGTILVFPVEKLSDRLFLLMIVVAAGAVGWRLTARLGKLGWGNLFGAGLVAGVLCAAPFVYWSGWVLLGGAGFGMFAMVPLSLVALAAQWITPRPRSLLDGVRLRRTWVTAALISFSFVALMKDDVPGRRATAALLLSASIIVMCAAADLLRLLTLESWRSDLGIGESVYELAAGGSPYRAEPQVSAVVHGDVRATQRILYRQLTFDAAALILAVLAASHVLE